MIGFQPPCFELNVAPHLKHRRGQHLTPSPKPPNKTPVGRCHSTKMSVRHPFAAPIFQEQKFVNGLEKVMHHASHNARVCVQVKSIARKNEGDLVTRANYGLRMETNWLDRIAASISLSGRSFRAISLHASLGANFVSEMIRLQRMPKTNQLRALCDVLGIQTGWVTDGEPIHAPSDRLLHLVEHLPQTERLKALKSFSGARDLSFSDLNKLAENEGVDLKQLQSALHFTEDDQAASETALEGAGMEAFAVGKDADLSLLMEIYQDVQDMEQAILGRRGRFNNRHQLIREIYLKRTKSTQ